MERRFTYAILWHNFDGGRFRFEASSDDNLYEAFIEAVGNAYLLGWTPPRWWQWWRWGDTRITPQEVKQVIEQSEAYKSNKSSNEGVIQ